MATDGIGGWWRRRFGPRRPDLPPTIFAAGQRWTFRNPPRPGARIVVGAVDSFPVLRVISVSLTEVFEPGPDPTGQHDVYFAPMHEDALLASIGERDGEGTPSDGFDEAYAAWKDGIEIDGYGAFDVPAERVMGLYLRTPG